MKNLTHEKKTRVLTYSTQMKNLTQKTVTIMAQNTLTITNIKR